MECFDCAYCWQGENDKYPRCHYEDDGFPAPCEWEDDYEEEYDEE